MTWHHLSGGLGRASLLEREGGRLTQRSRLERARLMMVRDPSAALDLDRLAASSCMSRFHFHRMFRRAYGMTPHAYLTERRLALARDLLTRTDRSVTAICMEVGFSSVGSFSAWFRRHVGHAPSHYRRRVVYIDRRRVVAVPACLLGWPQKAQDPRSLPQLLAGTLIAPSTALELDERT